MVIKNTKKGGNKTTTPSKTTNDTYVPSFKQIETNQVNKITNEALNFIHMDGFVNSMNPSFLKKKSLTKSNKSNKLNKSYTNTNTNTNTNTSNSKTSSIGGKKRTRKSKRRINK